MGEYQNETDPLRAVTSAWRSQLKLSRKHKHINFQAYADEVMRIFNGPFDWMWQGSEGEGVPPPTFQCCVNLPAEYVQIAVPFLSPTAPNRQVNPRQHVQVDPQLLGNQQDPLFQQQFQQALGMEGFQDAKRRAVSGVVEEYLNYISVETDLEDHVEHGVQECILKGMGLFITEMLDNGRGPKMPLTYHDSTDRLFIDPDAESWADVKWIALECVHPAWQVEQDYDLPPGYFRKRRGGKQSLEAMGSSSVTTKGKEQAKAGRSNDLVTYFKVFSKMGMGDKLVGVADDVRDVFHAMGRNCFLAICTDPWIPFPLNLPRVKWDEWTSSERIDEETGEDLNDEELFNAVQWPIPFWAIPNEADAWPVTPLSFHWVPDQVWPMSHIKPAIAEIRWLNWAMSYLMNRIKVSCTTTICVQDTAEDKLVAQLSDPVDFKVVRMEHTGGKSIRDRVDVFQYPQVTKDLWDTIAAVFDRVDRRLGTSEILYGIASTQSRSATDVNVRQTNATTRIQSMSKAVLRTLGKVSRKEAFAARWYCERADVLPCLGEIGADVWERFVMSGDIDSIVREYEYTIEASASRHMNEQAKAESFNAFMQTLPQLVQIAAQTGQFQTANWAIEQFGEINHMDMRGAMLQPPPPPDPNQPTPQQMQMQMEQQKAQAEIQGKQMDLQMKGAEMQMKQQESAQNLQFQAIKNQQDLEAAAAKHALAMQAQRDRSLAERARMVLEQRNSIAKARVDQASSLAKVGEQQAMARQKIEANEALAEQKTRQAKQPKK